MVTEDPDRSTEAELDARDLEVFEAVARAGGMNRAAAALNTVQSNVTAHIRALEAEIGTALFERHSRGVTLTAAGERLLPHAARVRAALDDAARAARDDGRPRGPLVVGSLETTAALRLSPLLARYVAAWPEVDLSLKTGTTCELVEATAEGRVEGAFVCGPVHHPDLVAEVAFEERLVVLTAPGVESFEAAIASGARIAVLRAGCSYRARLEALLAGRGVPGPRCLEFGTLEAIYGSVAAGLGITLLPRGLPGPAWPGARVRMHELPRNEGLVETLFVRRRDGFLSSALAAFLSTAREALPAAA